MDVLILTFVSILIGTYIKKYIWGDPNKPNTIFEYGRTWAAYIAFIIPLASIRWFLNIDFVDAIFKFLISMISYTFVGFCLGCLWGSVKLKLKSNIRFEKKLNDNNLRKISDQFWEQSIVEFDTNRNQGLWARCFTENDGNENKAKSMYLRIRAEELFLRNLELNKTTIKNKTPISKSNIQLEKESDLVNVKISNRQHLLFILAIISFGFGAVFLIYIISFLLKLIR